jgi:hypothetical protein
VGTWHDLDVGRPIAAPLERCAELLGIDLATIREAAANVEPYVRADGTRIWSLMQLERQLRPEAYGRRRGGYLDRRRTPATTDRNRNCPVHGTIVRARATASLSGFSSWACFCRLADEAAPFSAAPARPGRRARELGSTRGRRIRRSGGVSSTRDCALTQQRSAVVRARGDVA